MIDPDIHKIRSSYEMIGASSVRRPLAFSPRLGEAINTRRYEKGDQIIAKGERATTVCEVVRGSAFKKDRHGLVYRPGATFGAAGLFEHKRRMADIVAGENGTIVAFYDMRELSQSAPEKARELYNEAMEDIFRVLTWLEDHSVALEKQVARLKSELAAKQAGREEAGEEGVREKAGEEDREEAVGSAPAG